MKSNNPGYKYSLKQREFLKQLVSEGLILPEIYKRCEAFAESFHPPHSTVQNYRTQLGVKINDLIAKGELTALNTGLALRENRVKALQQLAEKMHRDLFKENLVWLDDAKTVAQERYDFKQFNKSQIDAYLRILDDIAKETGGRVTKVEVETKTYTVLPPKLPDDNG
jgi:hypothetical protein